MATMVTWHGLSGPVMAAPPVAGDSPTTVIHHTKKEKRVFFRPDATQPTPCPKDKGSAPGAQDISKEVKETVGYSTPVVVDKVEADSSEASNSAVRVNNRVVNGVSYSGYIYTITVIYTYKAAP